MFVENDGLEVVDDTATPEETTETPSEATTEETTEEVAEQPATETPSEPEVPSEPEAPLYELPDGRKVDAETVIQEYKNLQSDYTRKSQRLAEIEKEPIQNNEKPANPWEDPEWIPETAQELIEAAKGALKAEQEAERQAQEAHRQRVEQLVDSELGEIKKLDPSVNENLVFQHATKYGFNSLVSAYNNMKDMQIAVKSTERKTTQNIQKRAADPVATKANAPVETYDTYSDMTGKSMIQIAQEALASMKGK